LFDIIVAGKVDVVEVAITTNMETMQNEPAAAAKHQEEQAARLVPLLQLTDQQQELIPIGVRLYYDLLAGIHQERQEINRQMTAVLEADSGCTAANSCSASSATSGTQEQDLTNHRARLQQQQVLINRLSLLLDKEVRVQDISSSLKDTVLSRQWQLECAGAALLENSLLAAASLRSTCMSEHSQPHVSAHVLQQPTLSLCVLSCHACCPVVLLCRSTRSG
jgi:hypothetical protein